MYEIKKVSLKSKVFKVFCLVAGSLLIAFLYMWFVTSVLKVDLPKTAFLKAEHARLDARLDLLNSKMDRDQEILDGLRVRDEVRNAGIGGVDRYAYLDGLEKDNYLKNTALRLDRLTRQTTVQSKSFDEIASVSKTAGDMVSCIPAIPPIVPDPSKYHLSSPFGYRSDPFTTESKMHTGVDFAMDIGNPIYATGDGVVETVDFDFFGYGNCITIDHGFGYETKYAHLNSVNVTEGMKVKRGDCIAESGKSGRASGPHLHYEVIYKGNKVNPMNYLDLSMSKAEYSAMVRQREDETGTLPARRRFVVTSR